MTRTENVEQIFYVVDTILSVGPTTCRSSLSWTADDSLIKRNKTKRSVSRTRQIFVFCLKRGPIGLIIEISRLPAKLTARTHTPVAEFFFFFRFSRRARCRKRTRWTAFFFFYSFRPCNSFGRRENLQKILKS